MRKYLFLLLAIVPMVCMAQSVEPTEGFSLDLGTFTGIVAIVSAVVTQISKVFKAVTEKNIVKIGISALVGVVVCLIAWLLHVSEPLEGFIWWQVLIYGIAAGLSGCGLYGLIHEIGKLIKPKQLN